jgi:tRNA-2-methylthio-N6-dimethylallyladenosine synthase
VDIVKEVQDLVRHGYKEVTLLGQNVNSYGRGLEASVDFTALLKMVNDDTGVERIRFVTSHPRDLNEGLMRAIRDLPRVCEALHLPVQSGADPILNAMNRQYTREDYLRKVNALRDAVPEIALTTDIIVGFPGETEHDFAMTMKLLEDVRFDGIFAFKYSWRPKTAALRLSDHIPDDVKEIRLTHVLALQRAITLEQNKKHINTVKEILIDGYSKKGRRLCGRTRGNKVVNIEAPVNHIGHLEHVRITGAGANSLTGLLCE